jgi:hypothetical protein
VRNAGGVYKGYQANSDFSARRTMHSAKGRIGNTPRLKFQGAPAALEDRTGCLDITMNDDVLALLDPKFKRANFCSIILNSAWRE